MLAAFELGIGALIMALLCLFASAIVVSLTLAAAKDPPEFEEEEFGASGTNCDAVHRETEVPSPTTSPLAPNFTALNAAEYHNIHKFPNGRY